MDADDLPTCGIEKVRLDWTRAAKLVTCHDCCAIIRSGRAREGARARVGRILLDRRGTGIGT